MPSLSAVRASNSTYALPARPVAIFVGGTAGIGAGMARAFARHARGNAHIILVGRNRAAAHAVLASFPRTSESTYEFVECDVRLMANVQRTTEALAARLRTVHFLVMTVGYMTMQGREETAEGLDAKLAVHYYARWKFVDGLLPLLRSAKDAGEDAKVMSVLAAGHGHAIDLDDLGLKRCFSIPNAALAASTYNDLMIESFSARHPALSFIHAYPGIVRTRIFRGQASDWFLPITYPLTRCLTYLFAVSEDVCGEYMLYALYNAKEGASRMYSGGEDLGRWRLFTGEVERETLWKHTAAAVFA